MRASSHSRFQIGCVVGRWRGVAAIAVALATHVGAQAPDHRSLPNWSPDGRTILFVGGSYPNTQLYTVNPDGKNLRRVSRGMRTYEDPSWSPDGSKILFSTKRGSSWRLMV